MSNYSTHKQQVRKPGVSKQIQQELDKAPRQFNDYMNSINGRFSEICNIYLDGLSMDDVKYLKPDDFIELVPENQHKHKLLMTIMVRRYLYRSDNSDTVYCKPEKPDSYENVKPNSDDETSVSSNATSCSDNISTNIIVYACDKCTHTCTKTNCKHSCDDYVRITQRNRQT